MSAAAATPSAGEPPIRILLVEDCDDDAELLSIELRSSGMAFELLRVDEFARLRAALVDFAPDIVVSDANLPGFTGSDALHLARELAPALPFVFCTGYMEEDEASDAVPQRAEGVVLKHQLGRLPTLIRQLLAAAPRPRRTDAA